jgi:hypothetical protein
LCYRIVGEGRWHEGTTIAISKAEMLFRGDSAIPLGTRLEMKFMLPVHADPDSRTAVSCHGEIIRIVEEFVLASKISAPRLRRTQIGATGDDWN